MLQIISAILRHDRVDNKGKWDEPDRLNVNTPISFFEHDGQNLHVIEGFSGDSHIHIGFPYDKNSDGLAYGRVNRKTNKASVATDPDSLTSEALERIVQDIYTEYGPVSIRLEWQGNWYNVGGLLEDLQYYQSIRGS